MTDGAVADVLDRDDAVLNQTQPTSQDTTGRRRKRSGRRVLGLLTAGLLLLCLAGAWAYRYYTSDRYLRPRCVALLERLTGGQVALERVVFRPTGHIELQGLSLSVEAMGHEQAGRLLRADRVTLHYSTRALLGGRFEPIAVVLHEPTLCLTENLSDGTFNVEHLVPPMEAERTLPVLPRVYVERGRFQVAELEGRRFRVNGQIFLSGQMVGDAGRPGRYQYTLRQLGRGDGQRSEGVVVSGWFDLGRQEGQVSMHGLQFTQTWYDLLPSRARQAWTQFAPQGQLPLLTVSYDRRRGRRSQVELADVSLTLPQLTEKDYRFQLYGVSGRLVFSERGIAVEQLVGKVRDQDLEYRIEGVIGGYSADSPFELSLQTNTFTIPRSVMQIYALPAGVQRVMHKMDPQGQLRVTMKVSRAEPGGPVDYLGTATVMQTQASYDRFPYRLVNCHGLLRFDREKIEVLNLTGQGADGAVVTLNGTITPPSEDAYVDMTITAVDMPFDQALYQAFQPRPRQALDLFFHRPSEKRLLAQGNFITYERRRAVERQLEQARTNLSMLDEQDDAEALRLGLLIAELEGEVARPAFALGGRCDFIVHLTGGGGPDQDYSVTADVTIRRADMLFEHFPYPMHVTGGALRIEPGKVVFKDLELAGLYGGRGALRGQILWPEQQAGAVKPELELEAVEIPVDEPFYDAIAEPRDQWLRRLKLHGRINVVGRIFADATGRTDVDLRVDLNHSRAVPGEGKFPLEDIDGRLQLTLGRVRFDRLTARHGDGRLSLSGQADWSDRQAVRMRLDVTGEQLRFEDALFDLVEPFVEVDERFGRLWQAHQPRGRFDLALHYNSTGRDKTYDLAVRPRSLAMRLSGQDVEVEQVGGQVRLRPGRVDLDGLSGRVAGMQFRADGPVMLEEPVACDLQVAMEGRQVSPSLKKLLPAGLVELLEALKFQGGYRVKLDRLYWRPDAQEGLKLAARGQVEVSDASMMVGAPLENLSGRLLVDWQKRVEQPWARLQLVLQEGRTQVMGRQLTDLQASMQSSADSDLLVISALRGRLYGGVIGGTGRLGLADKSYQFRLALSGVDLVQLVDPSGSAGRGAQADGERQKISKGKVAASLDMRGRWDQPEKRQGRGDVQVSQAVLYDLPLAMGLLQVANLTLPMSRAFNKAQINYFIKDNFITFERIVLRSPTLQLIGSGTMAYDSRRIDLTLTSNNPKAWDLGPVSDIIDSVRDQLITIRVTGTADHPQVQVKQFHAITQAWRDVFGEDEPDSGRDGS